MANGLHGKGKAWKAVLLWLFVINLGIAFGAGLYEERAVISQWMGTSPQTWPNTGLLFWAYVTTGPLTILTIGNAIAAWKTKGPRRRWHLAAVAIMVVERAVTFSYFIPTMAGLMGTAGLSQGEIDAILSQWLQFNHVRHLLNLAGWLAAMKALTTAESRETDQKGA